MGADKIRRISMLRARREDGKVVILSAIYTGEKDTVIWDYFGKVVLVDPWTYEKLEKDRILNKFPQPHKHSPCEINGWLTLVDTEEK